MSLAMSSRASLVSCPISIQHSRPQPAVRPRVTPASAHRRQVTRMGNKGSGGPFAPVVTVVRDAVGVKEFNKLRGQAISLHSQAIKEFCKQIGVDVKQVQGVVRLAKKNGEWLGFLA